MKVEETLERINLLLSVASSQEILNTMQFLCEFSFGRTLPPHPCGEDTKGAILFYREKYPHLTKSLVEWSQQRISSRIQARAILRSLKRYFGDDSVLRLALMDANRGIDVLSIFGEIEIGFQEFVEACPMEFILASSKIIIVGEDSPIFGMQTRFVANGKIHTGYWSESGLCYQVIAEAATVLLMNDFFNVFHYEEHGQNGDYLVQYI